MSNLLIYIFRKWKEIIFKIKLTEAEYKLLLKEKAKGVINI